MDRELPNIRQGTLRDTSLGREITIEIMERHMTIFEPASPKWTQRTLGVLRMVTALLFMQHGLQKIFGFPPSGTPMPPYHFASLVGVAGVLELFGGFLLLIGLLSRPIAFLL